MFSKLPGPPNREQRTACRLSLALLTISPTFVSTALSPTPLEPLFPFFTSHPTEPYHFYFHQTPSANLPALLQLPHLSSPCGCPGDPLPFPSLYLKPLLRARGGSGSSRCSLFLSGPRLHRPASPLHTCLGSHFGPLHLPQPRSRRGRKNEDPRRSPMCSVPGSRVGRRRPLRPQRSS